MIQKEIRKNSFLKYFNKNNNLLNVEKFIYEYFLTLSLYRTDNNKKFWDLNIAELKKELTQEIDYWLNNTDKLYEYYAYGDITKVK